MSQRKSVKTFKKKTAHSKMQASQAQRRARTLSKLRQPVRLADELKFYDTGLAATAISAATGLTGAEMDPSATSMISTPVQGATASNRIGKQILIKSVQVKGGVTIPQLEDGVNPPPGNKVYVALVLDTQTNVAQLNSEDVFTNPSGDITCNNVPMRNLLFGERFRILKSQIFDGDYHNVSVEADNLHSASGKVLDFEWFVPVQLPVHFNAGTTASIANVIDNSLHVVAFSQQAGTFLAYSARIRFVG